MKAPKRYYYSFVLTAFVILMQMTGCPVSVPSTFMDCGNFQFDNELLSRNGGSYYYNLQWSNYIPKNGYILEFYHNNSLLPNGRLSLSMIQTDYQTWINWDSIAGRDWIQVNITADDDTGDGDTCIQSTTIRRPTPSSGSMICADLRLLSPLDVFQNASQNISWEALAGASYYRVNLYTGTDLLATWEPAAGDLDLSLSLTDDYLFYDTGIPITIELVALDEAGNQCSRRYELLIVETPPNIDAQIPTMACENLRLTSPLGGMGNGVQTFYWDALDNATSYHINIYYNGAYLGGWDAPAGQTSLSADVSRAAIGGETPVDVELLAFDDAGHSCRQIYSIAREAAPAQAPIQAEPTACVINPQTGTC